MGLMLTFIAAVGWIIADGSAPAAEKLRIVYPAEDVTDSDYRGRQS